MTKKVFYEEVYFSFGFDISGFVIIIIPLYIPDIDGVLNLRRRINYSF